MKHRAAIATLAVLLPIGIALYSCASKTQYDTPPQQVGLAPPAPSDRLAKSDEDLGSAASAPAAPRLTGGEAPSGGARGNAPFAIGEAAPEPLARFRQAQGADDEKRRAEIPPASSGEELWIIARSGAAEPAEEDRSLYPSLRAKATDGGVDVPLPLKHTDVDADVAGYIATVHVRQQYHNPYDRKIEAVYVFPLPQNAAVNEFVMTIGERRIRGIIREREEAERLYAEAKQQGYVASLLTQERPNIFTQSVANIEPDKSIDIDLTYFNTLAYRDGEYEFVFPMVVGPRFNPPGSTDGVGAVPRSGHDASGQKTEVSYLAPDERSGHDISLAVDVEGGMKIEDLSSPSHAIETTVVSPSRWRVALSRLDRVPNRDFVLRYKVAGDRVKTAFLTQRDRRGGYFTLMLQPPDDLRSLPRAPMELIFVLDCSGSMSGEPIALAKSAVERALRRLGPDDTFQIIRFSNDASQLGPSPIRATADNVERGMVYLRSLTGSGGTMMIEGIKAALDFPHDPRRLRVVSFMTDGYIGNEAEILGEVHRRLGASRIFSFGVGSSTNRYLLERMALLGNGAVAYVGLDEGSQRAVDAFYERISHPALTDVRIDWGGLGVSDVYPQHLPDLFVGRPIVVTGRFTGSAPATVSISGRAGGQTRDIALRVDPEAAESAHPAIASVWARMKIADLADRATHEDPAAIAPQITRVALDYGLMSAYTAFVAVDSSARTAGTQGTTVFVPVPVPDGVPYETTVE